MALGSRSLPGRVLPAPGDKRRHVRAMFDRIAPRYDALNRVLSLGLDRRWRRIALDAIAIAPADCVLDLACGTGDLSEMASARGARVIGIDFAHGMLAGARTRSPHTKLVQGDAAALPLPDAAMNAVVCGFALRNFEALAPVFAELARVLARDGRIALLDVDRPEATLLRAGHALWMDGVVPRIGAWFSDRAAYAYLPRSTVYLPPAVEIAALLEAAGFEAVAKRSLGLGAAQLWTARRRGDSR
jgi:demethylmenaquinone methyltransferase/2-methoxy-6-polyprenyl-1,4-benzoquinol methylase